MVTLCAVMMGLNHADKGILGFAAQPIMRDFKLSPVEFGYLGSSFFLLFAVSGIVLGFLADRWPSKHVMTAMAIGWALCLLPAAGQVGFVMSLATSGESGPHAANVLYVRDDFALLWVSDPISRHSRENHRSRLHGDCCHSRSADFRAGARYHGRFWSQHCTPIARSTLSASAATI
jgi:hypothetical protein